MKRKKVMVIVCAGVLIACAYWYYSFRYLPVKQKYQPYKVE